MSGDAESWAHKHARENPGHQAHEGLDDPGSCRDCAERSPAYNLVTQAKADALNDAADALLTVSPSNPNTGMDSVVAAWLQGRVSRVMGDA